MKVIAKKKMPEYWVMENELEIANAENFYGHQYGVCIGKVINGISESGIKKDKENGNTEIFDNLIKDGYTFKQLKTFSNSETSELYGAELVFVPYVVENHSAFKPTVTDKYITCAVNADYKITYEILFVADDELTRYLTLDYETGGTFSMSFCDILEGLRNTVEELFDNNRLGFSKDDDCYKVLFYDEAGSDCEAELSSIGELMHMINSLRVVDIQETIH